MEKLIIAVVFAFGFAMAATSAPESASPGIEGTSDGWGYCVGPKCCRGCVR